MDQIEIRSSQWIEMETKQKIQSCSYEIPDLVPNSENLTKRVKFSDL